MLKKYLLKGKQFLMKKLDELEIEREDLDYVAQQIPKKLHEKLKIFQSHDYDLESAMQYQGYFRTYPNHPISPLLYERFKEQKPLKYQINPKIKQSLANIPAFDHELQQKALRFKHAIDTYDEGIPELDQTLLCICVVHFHHKRGTQVQYRYPFNSDIQKIQDTIVHNAMPDSSHNKSQDYNFFNFNGIINGEKKMLFGVSYFKQIKLTQAMKAKNEQLTRSHVQKAVCVVSFLPIFGYLKLRLALTTKLFFENFTNFQSIKHAYLDMSKHLNETWSKMQYSELYIGTDLRKILKIFGYKLFQIYKAILFQKRIVIFSHSPSSSSSFILSILSLFPGLLAFGMYSKPINKYLQGLREYSLPLKLFTQQNPLILSFHIQDFHMLHNFKTKDCEGNYLIGTTNRLVKQTKNIGVQLLVNLEDCSLTWEEHTENTEVALNKHQKTFIDDILKVLDLEFTCGYEGSEDWIRDLFHNWLKDKLIRITQTKRLYLQFVAECNQYKNKRSRNGLGKPKKEYVSMEDQIQDEKKTSQMNPPEVDERILNMPLLPILNKSHFLYFLQFHNPDLYLYSNRYPCEQALIIQNWQYYLGSLPMKRSQFVTYNIKTRKLKFGNPSKFANIKELKFEENNNICEIFVGKVNQNKYHGQGILINENQYYEGEFQRNNRHGFGKLITSIETYIGYFENGLYNGQGQLINSINNTVYVGNFKDGLREGQGRLQKEQFVYEGEFQQNQMYGNGQIAYDSKGVRIFGVFQKGKIDESKEITIKYKNGDAYAGFSRNQQPHGKGTYRKCNGQILNGMFTNGQYQQVQKPDPESEMSKM